MDNILGYNLKKYREKHKLSQEEFANILGISRTALRGYESGKNHPTSLILISMANALNCSIDELLGHNISNPINISSSENITNIKEKIIYLDDLIKKTLKTHEELIASKKRTDLKYSELAMSQKRVTRILEELAMSNKRNDLTYAELERTINRLVKTQNLFKEITEKFISDIPDSSITTEDLLLNISDLSKDTFKGFSISSISTLEDKQLLLDEYITAPLYGRTAAGLPCFADNCIERTFLLKNKKLLSSYSYFSTTVHGDSMNKLYDNGDILLVKSQSFAKDGDLVIACINNEVTFKRFYSKDDNIILQPESTNPNHLAQTYTKNEIIINGVVLGKIDECISLDSL